MIQPKTNYISEYDIFKRLVRRHYRWQSIPAASLIGKPGGFGILKFYFKECTHEFNIYIFDRSYILNTANEMIKNHKKMFDKLYEEQESYYYETTW